MGSQKSTCQTVRHSPPWKNANVGLPLSVLKSRADPILYRDRIAVSRRLRICMARGPHERNEKVKSRSKKRYPRQKSSNYLNGDFSTSFDQIILKKYMCPNLTFTPQKWVTLTFDWMDLPQRHCEGYVRLSVTSNIICSELPGTKCIVRRAQRKFGVVTQFVFKFLTVTWLINLLINFQTWQ